MQAAQRRQHSKRLHDLEVIIERGLRTFVQVGDAMAEIRKRRLYTQPTWKAYLRERWHMDISHAKRLMDAAEVARELGDAGADLSYSSTRALVAVPRASREGVLKASRASGKPTARRIRQAAAAATKAGVVAQYRKAISDLSTLAGSIQDILRGGGAVHIRASTRAVAVALDTLRRVLEHGRQKAGGRT